MEVQRELKVLLEKSKAKTMASYWRYKEEMEERERGGVFGCHY